MSEHTRYHEFVVRIQAHAELDPEVLRRRLVAASEDHVSSYGNAHVVSVQPLDLETATGRQAYDHQRHEAGTTERCWCGQPHDHGMTP